MMIINELTVKDISEEQLYVHDDVIREIQYDTAKEVAIIHICGMNEDYAMKCYNVKSVLLSACNFWGSDNRMDGISVRLLPKSELDKRFGVKEKVIDGQPDDIFFAPLVELKIHMLSGDDYVIVCQECDIHDEIGRIFNLLDRDLPIKDQKKGIELSGHVKCLQWFFQPDDFMGGKKVWENCARVISERDDSELDEYLLDMLRWVRDEHAPGAQIIDHRLKRYQNSQRLQRAVALADLQARYEHDDHWLETLQKYM